MKVESENQKWEGQVTEGWSPRKGTRKQERGVERRGLSSAEAVGLGSALQDSSRFRGSGL